MSDYNNNIEEFSDETSSEMQNSVNQITNVGKQGMKKAANSKIGKQVQDKAKQAAKKAAKQAAKKAAMLAKKIIMMAIKLAMQLVSAIISAILPFLGYIAAAVAIISFATAAWNFITNINIADNNVYQTETVSVTDKRGSDPSSAQLQNSINNAWSGVFYSKYADQSLYTVIKEPTGDDSAYSGKTFTELGGTEKTDVLMQSGSEEFIKSNIRDIDNYEDQLKLDAGFISVLDSRLNDGYKIPEQFIKPIYSTCTKDNNFEDIDSCQLLLGEDDNITKAESTGYEPVDKETIANKTSIYEKTDEKAVSVADWGLGSIAKYQAYYQPSRVSNYHIKTVKVIDEDWRPGDAGTPVETLNWDSLTTDEQNAILEKYKRGASGVLDKNDDNTYNTGLYNVNSQIVYKDWEKAIEKGVGVGATFQNWLNNRETSLYSDNNRDYWASGDPGISSGVPNTTVVYAITDAITMYGKLNFDIKQEWISQGLTDHTQKSTYLQTYPDSSVTNDDVVQSVENGKGYKAVYDKGTLLGYMSGDAHATYTEPKKIEDTSDKCLIGEEVCTNGNGQQVSRPSGSTSNGADAIIKCEIKKICDPNMPYWEDGYWTVPLALDANGHPTDEVKRVLVSHSDPHPENKLEYSVAYKIEVQAITEGNLETLTVMHTDANISTDDVNASQYLVDYIDNYEAYIPANESKEMPDYTCYSDLYSTTLNEWSIDDAAGADIGNVAYSTTKDVSSCEQGRFSILDPNAVSKHTITNFNFKTMPVLQYLKGASLLGFTDDMQERDSVIVGEKDIVRDIGSDTSFTFDEMMQTYGELFERHGGAYGVDPKLLGLIASQEFGGICEGDYYNNETDKKYGNCNLMQIEAESDRSFKAYNFNLRENTQEKSEGGTTFYDVLKSLFNSGNTSDLVIQEITTDSIEKFTVNINDINSGKDGMSGVELSIKAAAMYLQNLIAEFDGNIPLAIMAYNYGPEGVNAALNLYEKQTGNLKDAIIENQYELGWTHYTEEIHKNPSKYIPGWTADSFGDGDYLYHVLSRMNFPAIYYIRTQETADNLKTVKGSAGTWVNYNAVDSEIEIAKAQKLSKNTQYVRKAYRELTKSSKLDDNWDILTSGQVEFKRGNYVKDGKIDLSSTEHAKTMKIQPNKTDTDINMIIRTAFAFNSDTKYNDIDFESKEFWKGRFSNNLTNSGVNKINSSLDPDDVFGEKTVLAYPLNLSEDDTELMHEFGVTYFDKDKSEYNTEERYKILEDTPVYAATLGVVEEVSLKPDGTWFIEFNVKGANSIFKDVVIQYNGLSETSLNVGDVVYTNDIVGTAKKDSDIGFTLLCDGEVNDLFGIISVYDQQERLFEMRMSQLTSEGSIDGLPPVLIPGWIPEIDNEKMQQFLDALVQRNGGKYVLGGNCDGGSHVCDCSGLVYGVLKDTITPNIPDMTANGMMHNLTTPINRSDLQPGDLVYFYPSSSKAAHVAVYMGPDAEGYEMIFHAMNPNKGIVYSYFNRPGYWCTDGIRKYDSWEAAAIGYGRINVEKYQ